MNKIVLTIWCAGLVVGGATHVFDNIYFGFLPYRFAPDWLNIYWSSLGLLDFLAVFLLWKNRKWGILLTIAIMISNVAVNSLALHPLGVISESLPLQLQSLFLGFCLGSAYLLWQPQRLPVKPSAESA
ncbi:hypothetical protein CWE09_07735 [Aliidiomarina minuta]|uniref:Uncharacterized protein n=1 Tax=Aliidiomarina minuta TaxID=880057 RepID=A0A432WAS8_9GAMM|nr:hypothetical protein CWE09_07735 [Aliidiomarina minuta]